MLYTASAFRNLKNSAQSRRNLPAHTHCAKRQPWRLPSGVCYLHHRRLFDRRGADYAIYKDDESDEDSTPPTSPPPVARRKFDDEEEDSDVSVPLPQALISLTDSLLRSLTRGMPQKTRTLSEKRPRRRKRQRQRLLRQQKRTTRPRVSASKNTKQQMREESKNLKRTAVTMKRMRMKQLGERGYAKPKRMPI